MMAKTTTPVPKWLKVGVTIGEALERRPSRMENQNRPMAPRRRHPFIPRSSKFQTEALPTIDFGNLSRDETADLLRDAIAALGLSDVIEALMEVYSSDDQAEIVAQLETGLPHAATQKPAIIITGNPVDGLNFYGPFYDHDAARIFGEYECEADWWVTELEPPPENTNTEA